jgi:hypothetical protein
LDDPLGHLGQRWRLAKLVARSRGTGTSDFAQAAAALGKHASLKAALHSAREQARSKRRPARAIDGRQKETLKLRAVSGDKLRRVRRGRQSQVVAYGGVDQRRTDRC